MKKIITSFIILIIVPLSASATEWEFKVGFYASGNWFGNSIYTVSVTGLSRYNNQDVYLFDKDLNAISYGSSQYQSISDTIPIEMDAAYVIDNTKGTYTWEAPPGTFHSRPFPEFQYGIYKVDFLVNNQPVRTVYIDFTDCDYGYPGGTTDAYHNQDWEFRCDKTSYQVTFLHHGEVIPYVADKIIQGTPIGIWETETKLRNPGVQNTSLFKNFRLLVSTPVSPVASIVGGVSYNVSNNSPLWLPYGFGTPYSITVTLPQSLSSNCHFSRWSNGVLYNPSIQTNVAGTNFADLKAIYKVSSQYNTATLGVTYQGSYTNSQEVYFENNGYVTLGCSYLNNHSVVIKREIKYDAAGESGEWFEVLNPWFYVTGEPYSSFRMRTYLKDLTDTVAIWSNEAHAVYVGPPPPPPSNCPFAFKGKSIAKIDQTNVDPCASILRESESQMGHASSGFIKHRLDPFHSSLVIKFGIGTASNATMKVYDNLGNEIKTLFGEYFSKGKYATYWNGTNENGQNVPEGEYTFKLKIGAEEYTQSYKFVSLAGIEFPITNPDMLTALQKREILRLFRKNLSNMKYKFRWKATDPYIEGNDLQDVSEPDDELNDTEDILVGMTIGANTGKSGDTKVEILTTPSDPNNSSDSTKVSEAKNTKLTDEETSGDVKDRKEINSKELDEDKIQKIQTNQIQTYNPVPKEFVLHTNYPNPFNPITTIQFDLPERSNLTLVVYNMNGQRIRDLVSGTYSEGIHYTTWDAKDNFGRVMPSGIYIYRLQMDKIVLNKKMMLVK